MKFDLLFEICVPRPWTEGKERAKFHEALEQAAFAEEMGFHTIWMVEHHFLTEMAHSSASEVFLGALSQRTSRIRLGFGVSLMPGRVNHPIRIAERAAVTDILSDGRVEMGTGRSSSPYQLRAFGVDVATTREEWEEGIRLLPELWSREKFAYSGTHYQWEDEITVVPRPLQKPHPPLWVASTQPETCALAGQKGIGLLLSSVRGPTSLEDRVAAYKDAIAAPIDQIGAFKNEQCALFTVAFCNDDDEKARVLGGQAGAWYLKTVGEIYANDWAGQPLDIVPDSYRYHAEARQKAREAGNPHGGGNWGADLDVDITSDRGYEQLIDNGAFCVGNPKTVIENVKRYRDVGADRLVCVMQLADLRHEDLMHSIELFGREVIPAFEDVETAPAASPAAAS